MGIDTRKAEYEAYVAAYLAEVTRTAQPVILAAREIDRQRTREATAKWHTSRLALAA